MVGTVLAESVGSVTPVPEELPLYIEPLYSDPIEFGLIYDTCNGLIDISSIDIQYSYDMLNWYPVDWEASPVDGVFGYFFEYLYQRVYFRGDNTLLNSIPNLEEEIAFGLNIKTWNEGRMKVGGNIMSLAYSDLSCTEFPYNDTWTFTFANLFIDAVNIFDASELILPASVMNKYGYYQMFANCSNLMYPPELPATTLAKYCYSSMFAACVRLQSLPILPATELESGCYGGMFGYCQHIKLSEVEGGIYTKPYRIPTDGVGIDDEGALNMMFYGTGGSFTGTPTINTTYYLAEE